MLQTNFKQLKDRHNTAYANFVVSKPGIHILKTETIIEIFASI